MVLKVFVTELDLLGLKRDHIFAIICNRLYRKRGNGAIPVPNGRGRHRTQPCGHGRVSMYVGSGTCIPSHPVRMGSSPPSLCPPPLSPGHGPSHSRPVLGPLSPSTWPSVLSTEMVGTFPIHRSVQMQTKQETNESSRKRERDGADGSGR